MYTVPENVSNWLNEHGFTRTYQVDGQKSISRVIDSENVCGIYVLHFSNEQYYIGMAKNVVKRYSQHFRTHLDIIAISFKPLPLDEIKQAESKAITIFKSKVLLRNIDEMEDLIMERKFDKLVESDFLENFIKIPTHNDWSGEKYCNKLLQNNYRYKKAYDSLRKQPYYHSLIFVLRQYIKMGLPAPFKTEYGYWSVTCFEVGKSNQVVVRLNVYQQEVFTAYVNYNYGEAELEYCFHLAKSPLTQMLASKSNSRHGLSSLEFVDFHYRTGGKDQIRMLVQQQDTKRLLQFPAVTEAIRLHNLRLMRKGTNMNRVSHCMGLAQEILSNLRS